MKIRFKAALGVAIAAVALIGSTGTANAYVKQDNVAIRSTRFLDHHLTNLYGSYQLASTDFDVTANVNRWKITSAGPDTGYPNVQIRNNSSGRCMRAMSATTVQMKSCNDKDPYQIWAMTQGSYGTQFFNFAVRSCLDNGNNSPYLFHEEGCNVSNEYQSWLVQ